MYNKVLDFRVFWMSVVYSVRCSCISVIRIHLKISEQMLKSDFFLSWSHIFVRIWDFQAKSGWLDSLCSGSICWHCSHACKEITLAEFILETNYPSEKCKSSRYKSGVQPNFGPKFVSSVSTSTRRAARQRQEVKMNLAPKFLRCIICPRWMISINSAIFI